jgi:hypothetical protein
MEAPNRHGIGMNAPGAADGPIAVERVSDSLESEIAPDSSQVNLPFFRFSSLQVGIDELQPRSISVGQSRDARDKELL